MQKIISKSPKQTELFAQEVAAGLKGGEILALIGELGAGKTFFTKSLALTLGVRKKVTSPTFILLKTYKTKNKKIKIVYHLDAYRLKKAKDFIALGVLDFLGAKNTLTIIEWADKFAEEIKKLKDKNTKIVWVKLEYGEKENKRVITVTHP